MTSKKPVSTSTWFSDSCKACLAYCNPIIGAGILHFLKMEN